MSVGFPDFSSLDLQADPKGCCARLYESEAARWLLDGDLHPGGERLTLRLTELAGIAPGQRVLDVACGTGATTLLLARERAAETVGVDPGAETIERAQRHARALGLIAVADVTAVHDALPAALRTAAARVACIADALHGSVARGRLRGDRRRTL